MDNTLYGTVYNPDVLSCLANLSNDEVFTPPRIVNEMLDLLPQELFQDPNITFLDPACKSGVFLRENAKRLIKGLAGFPDAVLSAAEKYEPSLVARFCVDTAQKFNKFYLDCKIMQAESEELRTYRLRLTQATLTALTNALTLLGIGVPEKM